MRLKQILQDTVCLMEGGHVSRPTRPGEYFETPVSYAPRPQSRLLPLRLLMVWLSLFV